MTSQEFVSMVANLYDETETAGGFTSEDAMDTVNSLILQARKSPRFKRERWLGYIRGENGPNGGKR